jgi:hypothetical protein
LNLTYSPRALLVACALTIALVAPACGSSDTGASPSPTPDAGDDEAGDGAVGECTGATTKSCACSSDGTTRGTKKCQNGKFSACSNCTADVIKDAAVSNVDLCKAGYYSGEFSGTYKPGAFGFGLGMSLLEVPITGTPFMDIPALSFNLEQQATGVGEFMTYTVGQGCMTGNAQAYGTDNPIVARVSGSLDCSTGIFTGTLTGHYKLLNFNELPFEFTGPLKAMFMLPSSIKDGTWTVSEPPAADGEAAGGGMGTWSADWKSDDVPYSDVDPCAEIPYEDGGLPAPKDGGSTPTHGSTDSSDAGIVTDSGST